MNSAVRNRELSANENETRMEHVSSEHENENETQVGARQGTLRLPSPGGGYQNIYTAPSAALKTRADAADLRIAELRKVGIPSVWIRVAREIGFEAFMAMWRVLMQGGHVDERCRVVVPNHARYLRYQRNQLIRQLVEDGHGIAEVRAAVKTATGEDISESHIRRAAARA